MPQRIVNIVKENKPKGLRMNVWLALVTGLVIAIPLACVVVFWGQIREAAMDPATPFQTAEHPPAPDYFGRRAWALLPAKAANPGDVDIFFVHPTTHQGRRWNAAFDNDDAARRLRQLMLPNYAGPFAEVGRVYAPHYRQASLYTQITLREDARDARAFAYQDVMAAFDHYLAQWNGGRPVIIVGVEQGALLASRLSAEAAGDPAIKQRLVAVYLLETAEPAGRHSRNDVLPACQSRAQAGCVVAYLATAPGEAHLLRNRIKHAPLWTADRLVPLAKAPILCVNPLTGSATNEAASSDLNLGAANASGLEWGTAPGPQSHQVGAQCRDGVLHVTRPRSNSLHGRASWADAMRVRPYNWFYADLTADAKARIAAFTPPPPAPPASSQTAR